jgi:hypothetical protein
VFGNIYHPKYTEEQNLVMGFKDIAGDNAGGILAIIIVIVLVLVFLPQLIHLTRAFRTSVVSALSGKKPTDVAGYLIPEGEAMASKRNAGNAGVTEHMDPNFGGAISPEASELMEVMGYGDDVSWGEVLKTSELDPSTFANHQDFVKDVRRFSSGANFTSVTDDNTNSAFTNFVGLRRPQHVDIGASARQQPDIDQSVLKRSAPLRWGYAAKDSTYLTAEQELVPAGQYQFDNAYEGNVQNAENFVNW